MLGAAKRHGAGRNGRGPWGQAESEGGVTTADGVGGGGVGRGAVGGRLRLGMSGRGGWVRGLDGDERGKRRRVARPGA